MPMSETVLTPRADIPVPRRLATLPRDRRGYVVPFFVDWVNGEPSFPLFDPAKWRRCVAQRLCWLCGQPLGRNLIFVIGPMCSINRITSEPPSHADCADYALKVCPFLINPAMRRVPDTKKAPPEAGPIAPPAGQHDDRNPGVMLFWATRTYSLVRTETGPLISIGDPFAHAWWTRGRIARPQEAADAFQAGATKLLRVAATEGEEAVVELAKLAGAARKLLPDPELVHELSVA
jgi:hypothetical protein